MRVRVGRSLVAAAVLIASFTTGAVVTGAGPAQASTNLLTNGTFDADLSGWDLSYETACRGYLFPPQRVSPGNTFGIPVTLYDGGAAWLDACGVAPHPRISQTLAVTPGIEYRIAGVVLVGVYQFNPANPYGSFYVTVDGVRLTAQYGAEIRNGWVPFTASFTPSSSSVVVAFTGEVGGDYDYYVDSLSVESLTSTTQTSVDDSVISWGSPVAATATVSAPSWLTAPPTGSVAFSTCFDDTTTVTTCDAGSSRTARGSAMLSPLTATSAQAQVNVEGLAAGYYMFYAQYAGDDTLPASADSGTSSAPRVQVTKATNTPTVTGGSRTIAPGETLTVEAVHSVPACATDGSPTITFGLVGDPTSSTRPNTDGFELGTVSATVASWSGSTSGWADGTYQLYATFNGSANCDAATVSGPSVEVSTPATGGWSFFPPSAPQLVSARADDGSVTVTWGSPLWEGSFPVDSYEAVLAPGGKSCTVAAPTFACTVTGLANGTAYTARVRASNYVGWGDYSASSAEVVPTAPPSAEPVPDESSPVVIVLSSGERVREGRRDRVTVTGSVTGLQAGTEVVPFVSLDPRGEFRQGVTPIPVGSDGSFIWTRRIGRERSIFVYIAAGSERSAVVSQTPADRSR